MGHLIVLKNPSISHDDNNLLRQQKNASKMRSISEAA